MPRFQRGFAWNDEAIGFFIADIEAILPSPSGASSHFFGGIVCIELTDNQQVRPHSYEIVDGQQRLTTFFLTLSCIVRVGTDLEDRARRAGNDSVAQRAKTLVDDTVERYLTWKQADVQTGTTEVRPRLSLSLADDTLFQYLSLGRGSEPQVERESHRLLVDGHAALLAMVRRFVKETGPLNDRIERLIRVRKAIIEDSHVIHIVSKERDQAYRLFSVLNHRGESLSDADLLRSRSLELLASYTLEHESTALIWDEMLGHPAKDVENFFKALYPSYVGTRAVGDLYEAIERRFFPSNSPSTAVEAAKIVATIGSFRDELNVFLHLLKGAWPYDREPGKPRDVRSWQMDRLRRLITTLKHELCLPVLLAGARSLPEKMFAELVYLIEIFAFRYKIICNGHATRPANIYYSEAALMRESANGHSYTLSSLRSELRKLIEKHAGDILFRQLLIENLRYNNSSQRANIREFLTTLEDHRSWLTTTPRNSTARPRPSMEKVIDLGDATIEHIYPQNAKTNDKDNDIEPLKQTLGNLTFFGSHDNVAASNKSFTEKRVANYASSAVAMTADLALLPSWTVNSVSAREQLMLDAAVRVFTI
nr:DUF262 domain-containing protein [Mycolicibacterium celeriflavum]